MEAAVNAKFAVKAQLVVSSNALSKEPFFRASIKHLLVPSGSPSEHQATETGAET